MSEKFLWFDNPKNVIYTCLAALLVVGCINLYSASFIYAANEMGNSFHFVSRYVFFAFGSLLVGWLVRKVGYKLFLETNVLLGLGIVVLLSLIYVLVFGVEINSARRWITLIKFSIQPSEFAKLFLIMLCSGLLGKNIDKGRASNIFYTPATQCLLVGLLFGILVAVEPDAGTGIIIFALALLMVFISGLRWPQVIMLLGLGVAGGACAVLWSPYRLERIRIWLNPWIDPTGAGYQMVQSLIAIGSGQLTGMEWGSGTAKFFFLPELHTDFAFAIFCQENGFFGALALICGFLFLTYGLWLVMRRSSDSQGTLLVSGVIMLVVGQSAINMAMVCGLIPVSGVPLSFISYGGSNLFVSIIAIFLALSVYDRECEVNKGMSNPVSVAPVQAAGDSPWERRSQWQVIDGGKK